MTLQSLHAKVKHPHIHVYDARTMPFDSKPISHFALTDALMNEVGKSKQAILHFWPTDPVVFLGMQDTRLPYFKEALGVFESAGYDYVVRNSGGLGVVSDPGITNLSLILPNESMTDISIDQAYELMYELMQAIIHAPIDAVEIEQSYCPGDFDLSIGGQKISGISQRRRAGAVAIMLYLSISGDQDKRSLMMKDFYDQGLAGEESQWHFPDVDPAVMTTISAALQKDITTDQIEQDLVNLLEDSDFDLLTGTYTDPIRQDFQDQLSLSIKRNQRMLSSHS